MIFVDKLFLTFRTLGSFLADIKVAHSVFALPFAFSALTFVRDYDLTISKMILSLLCMVTARSFAMGMNRYIDRSIDQRNPRTIERGIPSGRVSEKASLLWSWFFACVFVLSSWFLNSRCGLLAIPVLGILGAYSYMKRLSWLTHWYLGLCLGLSPVAMSLALTDSCPLAVLCLGGSVLFWTAGFDILYALQDREFDVSMGLFSAPAAFGVKKALYLSRISFLLMVTLLFTAGFLGNRGPLYFLGTALIGSILIYEHWSLRGVQAGEAVEDKINYAFFQLNGYVSILFGFFALLDRLLP